MSNRKRVLILILIMALSSLMVAGITIFSLYQAAVSEQRERLVETAQSQARLIEAVARFGAAPDKSDGLQSTRTATLSQIIDAHENYEQSDDKAIGGTQHRAGRSQQKTQAGNS